MDEFARGIRDALDGMDGVAKAEGYEVAFGGACPVQGYGYIDGHFCYFRARHDEWRVEVFARDSSVDQSNHVEKWCDEGVRPIYTYESEDDNTGWQKAAASIQQIAEAVDAFRSWSLNPD